MFRINIFAALFSIVLTVSGNSYRPCQELSRELRLPCRCALGPIEAALDGNPAISVDCDRVVFPGDFPNLPYGAPIVTFRQRYAGYQVLPIQAFAQSALPIRSLDFSGNSLRRLTERLLVGLQDSLIELRLADNLLGDTLNPIFSSSEFHGLKHLQLLDISGNTIKAIEEGILEGCENLQELFLDRNSLSAIPGASLNGPKTLRILSIRSNRISNIKSNSFDAQKNLDIIDLTDNIISGIEGGAFEGLDKLKSLKLGHNKLSKFNSDVFQGADHLQYLDLSENFIVEFPTVAFKAFIGLRYLNLSSNLIQSLDNTDLATLTNLYHLDLSRNNIANIVPGTFLGLKQLRRLDISVNSLRTIEDDAFEGLDNLEYLNLKDNNILLIPASALGRLPRLSDLQLDYNRITALSGEILSSIAERVKKLVISKNVVRELPVGSFQNFKNLQELDLTRNLLGAINTEVFNGLENSLEVLKLGHNKISGFQGKNMGLNKLTYLDLSFNQLSELSRNSFTGLGELRYLNLSGNAHLTAIPTVLLENLNGLKICDLSALNLKSLSGDLFGQNLNLQEVHLMDNLLEEIPDNFLVNLRNLTLIDLSGNKISNIKNSAFVNVMNIKILKLGNNQLSSFKGEVFNTGTGLELLDLSNNQLSYLYPSSFRIHPRLKRLDVSNNKFNFFPAELIANLQFLEFVDLSGNFLKVIEELDFAKLPRLRVLNLQNNLIENVSEMAFHNSTQLQILNLRGNRLERLPERAFENLIRIELLDLQGNLLNELPETIFERSRLQILENINLAYNKFEVAPFKSLQRQYFFLNSVNLSGNSIKDIQGGDSVMVNIKNLDLSFNPLTESAVTNIMGEPKTIRELNLESVGITTLSRFETPFLKTLNLRGNKISDFNKDIFERTTLLEYLDLSRNEITDMSEAGEVWKILRNLQQLDISENPINSITHADFENLGGLKVLKLHGLTQCSRVERTAFKQTPNLSVLDVYNYPKLGYLDIQGLLANLGGLERLNIETKDAAIGSEQLISILHPRLKELGIHGSRLRSISSGALSGLKGGNILIGLMNTSLTTLPPSLFFPVPRSTVINLDVTGSQLTTISPQLLVTLDDRRGDLSITGLETNPIICDCAARALRRWLPAHMRMIKCTAPAHHANKSLTEISDSDLTCDPHKVKSTPSVKPIATTKLTPKTTEPEIIWSLPPSTEKTQITLKPVISSINNDDTLIIGIVGGVVAFIAILIIIICIIRLRMSGNQYRGGPLAAGVIPPPPMSSCATCSVKGGAPAQMYYAHTLPHKIHPPTNAPVRPAYSTISRVPPYTQPYFIATYPSDEKIYR